MESRLETSEISKPRDDKQGLTFWRGLPYSWWASDGLKAVSGDLRHLFHQQLPAPKTSLNEPVVYKTSFTALEALLVLQEGREEGLDYFFHQHYASLTYFAFRLVEDQLPAEEIASETFVKLWEHREKFTTPAYLKNWLYNTVRNASIDHLRKAKRLRVSEQGLQTPETVEQSVLHRLIEAETLQQLIRLLDLLPPKCRQVFRLYSFEGLTDREIAKALQISPHTAKNQRNKAVRILREKARVLSILLCLLLFVN